MLKVSIFLNLIRIIGSCKPDCKYLKGDPGRGLFYSASSEVCLQAFSDADWSVRLDSRRSTTGLCVFLGDSLISWKSRKQKTIFRSSAESEYCALVDTTCELLGYLSC